MKKSFAVNIQGEEWYPISDTIINELLKHKSKALNEPIYTLYSTFLTMYMYIASGI